MKIRTGCLNSILLTAALLAIGCGLPVIPPGPTPDPVIREGSKVVIVEESSERSIEAATVLGDIAFWANLGVQFRIYDDDSPDAEPYLPLIKERPGMLLLDKTGKKLWTGKLPSTTREIERLVKP